MAESRKLSYAVSQTGEGWCWEVHTPDRLVVARGVADNSATARSDAMHAAVRRLTECQQTVQDIPCTSGESHSAAT
jgi:hypothetical protein